MKDLTYRTLLLLEDAGMRVRYPEFRQVMPNGVMSMNYSSMTGRRVTIEGNPHIKIMMLFTLLDWHVDAAHPEMEGMSFTEKYTKLAKDGDYNLILSQLFRLARVIRNTLVHGQSSFTNKDGFITIDRKLGKHHLKLKMSLEAFDEFQTAIVMYVKGDMGKGSYFLGIMRSVYASILAGIEDFQDENGSTLIHPSSGLKMKTRVRQVVLKAPFEDNGEVLQFPAAFRSMPDWESLDIFIVHENEEFLIPLEALDGNKSITKIDLINNWKREGSNPSVENA